LDLAAELDKAVDRCLLLENSKEIRLSHFVRYRFPIHCEGSLIVAEKFPLSEQRLQSSFTFCASVLMIHRHSRVGGRITGVLIGTEGLFGIRNSLLIVELWDANDDRDGEAQKPTPGSAGT
jgi:hypothetical protein